MTKRVLVVEDNAFNRQLVKDLLELDGHDVVEATSAEEATARLADGLYDLILLDIELSGGSGEEVLREVRRHPDLSGVAVMAVTAYAMQGDRERFLSLGFDDYMSKPIDTRRFRTTVGELLAKREEGTSM